MPRARVVLILSTLALLLVVVAGAAALAESTAPSRRSTYGIALDRLAPDRPAAVEVVLPGPDAARGRIAFVRHDGEVSAFLASDPRYGCALSIAGERDFATLYGSSPGPEVVFYDNCGGATYGVDGRCAGGPCLRNLDEYPVRLVAGRAVVDVRRRRSGGFRPGARRLPAWCPRTNPAALAAETPGGPPDPTCR